MMQLSSIGFPSPTGVNHYELKPVIIQILEKYQFPSPTGVNHYESQRLSAWTYKVDAVSVPNRG